MANTTLQQTQATELFAEFDELIVQLGEEAARLWTDAIMLFRNANKRRVSVARKASLLRAAVIMAAAALEGWTNFLAEKLAQDGRAGARVLTEAGMDCLCERRKVLRDGKVIDDKARYSSIDRFLLLFRLLTGSEPRGPLRAALKLGFETRDELVHPKPAKPFDILESGRGWDAFSNFLGAEVILARAWKKAKSVKPGPILVHS